MKHETDDLFMTGAIHAAMTIARVSALEAKGRLQESWIAAVEARVKTEIKNTPMEGFSAEEETVLYDAALAICTLAFRHLRQETEIE